jgi:hypothetical protein
VKKFFYVLAIVLLTPVGVAAGALTLWWFTTTNTASVNLWNRSHSTLRNIIVSVPGRSDPFAEMAPGDSGGFPADPKFTYDVHVSFDADGRHYDLPARIHMLPVGDSIVSLSIDGEFRLSVSAKPTFMFR